MVFVNVNCKLENTMAINNESSFRAILVDDKDELYNDDTCFNQTPSLFA